MASRNPSIPKRTIYPTIPPETSATPNPRRHVYVVMYSERAGPATTPVPYHSQIIAFTKGISLTPKEVNTTYTLAAPSATGSQKVEILTLSNRGVNLKIMSFMFNTIYGPPTDDEPGGEQKVWMCGWTEHPQEAVWIMEEMIRREEVGTGKGLSTMQPQWKWEKGPGGWLNRAIWETDGGDLLQYDVLRVEVHE